MSNWISVEDELPRLLQSVLVSIKNNITDGLVTEAIYQISGEFISTSEVSNRMMRPCVGVTHWMPLPEPHQEG